MLNTPKKSLSLFFLLPTTLSHTLTTTYPCRAVSRKIARRSVTCLLWMLLLSPSLRGDDQPQILPDGVEIVTVGQRRAINEMAVYPPKGIPSRPLLLAAHGNGGSGPKEITGWLAWAKQHDFTIICPTFLSAVHSMYVPEDLPYFQECLRWVEANLQFDRSNAFMTGFSGGGYAVWYLATTRPDFFKGLFLQSGNFAGTEYFGLDTNLPKWSCKPIHLVWGSEDSPTVIAQNKQAMTLLRARHLSDFTTEVIQGAHHEPHHNLVVNWMEQVIAAPDRAN